MTFHELPQKWKMIVTVLRILAVALPITFLVNVWMTLGSLLMVMVGCSYEIPGITKKLESKDHHIIVPIRVVFPVDCRFSHFPEFPSGRK